MRSSPAFQFYPSDWMTGAPATMSPDETHIYVWLLCREWMQVGFTEDTKELAKWCRLPQKRFLKAWARVRGSFVERDGQLYHPRLDRERAKQAEWREKSSRGGHKSSDMKKAAKGGSTTLEPPLNHPTNQTSTLQSAVSSLLSSDPVSSASTGDAIAEAALSSAPVQRLLERLPELRRPGYVARITNWVHGEDLPAGVRPTVAEIVAAIDEYDGGDSPDLLVRFICRKVKTMREHSVKAETSTSRKPQSFAEMAAARKRA